MQVRSLAETCSKLFEERLEEFNDPNDDEALDSKKQLLVTQSARFNLWADNTGKLSTQESKVVGC